VSHDQDLASVKGQPLSKDEQAQMLKHIAWASERLQAAKGEVLKDIFDQDEMVTLILTAMVGGGNILAEGMPGLAKTRTIRSISQATGLSTKRIQFTADLQPIDLTGSEVMDKKTGDWGFRPGPLFAQLVLADEVNRASEKTQSGLLEAMEEKQVTVDGVTRVLPKPYIVMATQNPVDQGGTNKLPEAQADRFMLKIVFKYASAPAEKKIALTQTSTEANIDQLIEMNEQFKQLNSKNADKDVTATADPDSSLKAQTVMSPQDLFIMQKIARKLPVDQAVVDAAVNIVRALRPGENDVRDEFVENNVEAGPSPRSEIAFLLAAKALVLVDNFNKTGGTLVAPTTKDIARLAAPILGHRLIMKPTKDQDVGPEDVIKHVLKKLQLA